MDLMRHPFVVAKGLEQFDGQALVFAHRPEVPGGAGEVGEVRLEQLDPVEARRGDGVDLLGQGAA